MSSFEANSTKGRARSCLCRWNSEWINLYNFLFQSWGSVCSHYFNHDSSSITLGEESRPGAFHKVWQKSLWLLSVWFSLHLWDAGVVATRALCFPCHDLTLFWLENSRQVKPWWPLKESQAVPLGFALTSMFKILKFWIFEINFCIFF